MIFLEIIPIFFFLLAGLLFSYGSVSSALAKHENKIIQWITIFILIAMGYKIGSIPDIFLELLTVGKIVLVFVIMILVITVILFYIFFSLSHQLKKTKLKVNTVSATQSKIKMLGDSSLYLSAVILGFLCALLFDYKISAMNGMVDIALYLLLFVIGQQLRQQEIKVKHLILNSKAIMIALLSMISSWVAGLISACILGMKLKIGLALSSGFGWYSLSGILVSQLGEPQLGAAVFFIDLIRELLSILVIPVLFKINYQTAIGYSGAPAMDFTLPILKGVLNKDNVMLCIVSGLVLSIATPIFIPLWLSI